MPNPADSDAVLDQMASTGGGSVHHRVNVVRDWLPEPDTLTFDVNYRVTVGGSGSGIVARLEGHELRLDEPLRLSPVTVPKPWGREIWLTGMEARGESSVVTSAGTLPLSHYLALAPRHLAGGAPLVLLKVLDPSPEPVLGDLYFEAHERKREVYVVTHVDSTAWPDGRGAIRYGMNQDLRRRYADDDAFRRDYLQAVKRYEAVRRAIDAGHAADARQEAELRAAMDAFTGIRPLTAGEVVTVPPWLPHSLQHGVRVVEFQTPTYERHILSFAQQVRTQDHWDTEAVIDRIRLDCPAPPRFDQIADGLERIASFDDFGVWRISLAAGAELPLPDHLSYGLCVVVRGMAGVGPLDLGTEQAAFIPGAALAGQRSGAAARLENRGTEPAMVLLAAPGL